MKKSNGNRGSIGRFLALTPAQREAEVREFDQEFIADTFKPLTGAARAAHMKAVRQARRTTKISLSTPRRGRPPVGEGAARINISIERKLLAIADAAAKREKIGRSELIARSLTTTLRAG